MNLDVIIVATCNLAQSFVDATQMIVGPRPNLHAVRCDESGDMIKTGNLMAEMIQGSRADFTIIFTDSYGSTPTGAALLSIAKCNNAAVITGVNLISIIQALELSEESANSRALMKSIERDSRSGIRIITGEDVLDTRG